jgi:hypothetical protein
MYQCFCAGNWNAIRQQLRQMSMQHRPELICRQLSSLEAHWCQRQPCLCRNQIEELTLKASAATELKILFEEPWLVQTSHARLKGDVPLDREWNSLCALASE